MMKPIYLDYNATTPIDSEVADAMLPFLKEHFGNPSSSHWYGIQTKKAIQKARKQVASSLSCNAEEIIFTSGGTESNNFAIKGIAFANRAKGNHIITSTIEHPAVIEVCKFLEKNGFDISYISVDKYGIVNLTELEKAITSQTILITIMHANNEVGTIQPIKEISEIAEKNEIIFHTDAAQSVGKTPTNVNKLGVDLLSVAGHKLYAPKGIGALYIRQGIKLEKFMHGADHEQDQRAGTENVLEIVGLGKACEIAGRNLEKNMAHMKKMRDKLYNGLIQNLEDIKLNGHPTKRLPNTLSLSFPNLEADGILSELEEVAASAGAACHSDSIELSPVLTAMNIPEKYAMGTIRFSTGRKTTEDEIDKTIDAVTKVINQMRTPSQKTHLPESKKVKLTHFTAGLGCACKLRPQALEKILSSLSPILDPNVIVGTNTADDAAVYKLDENTAIVQTVDFFTPIVDDPYDFGAIAAANAFSDVYAMGAKPLFALNIVGFPSNRLPMEILKQILLGAEDKAKEAGVSIIGGHTIDDNEPKYGLVVLGVVHPDKILKNSDAKPGDILILTKPIGLGIISTAMKRGLVEEKTIKKAIQIMSTLNKKAAEIMKGFPVNSCTDVTGFGLLGHLKEMTESSQVDADIYFDKIPTIDEAWELIVENVVPGGTLNNLDYVKEIVVWDNNISRATKILLCDAQTSGGLLIAVPAEYADDLLKKLHQNNLNDSSIIGKFTKKGKGKIFVKKSCQE